MPSERRAALLSVILHVNPGDAYLLGSRSSDCVDDIQGLLEGNLAGLNGSPEEGVGLSNELEKNIARQYHLQILKVELSICFQPYFDHSI